MNSLPRLQKSDTQLKMCDYPNSKNSVNDLQKFESNLRFTLIEASPKLKGQCTLISNPNKQIVLPLFQTNRKINGKQTSVFPCSPFSSIRRLFVELLSERMKHPCIFEDKRNVICNLDNVHCKHCVQFHLSVLSSIAKDLCLHLILVFESLSIPKNGA